MHLSDLHLGKCVLEQSMIDDQKYILNQIMEIVKDKDIDVVMIAGDVYDRSIPTVDAVSLFSNFLANLYKLGAKVLVISGNHDSKDRLSFGNELFYDNDVYIEGFFKKEMKKVTFVDEFGNINFYLLPFIKPADVRGYFSDNEINSYDDAVRCVIENADIDINERNVIMVHQFVTASGIDVERSESEAISLGGIDNVDVSIFDKFDYVAMGHIHGACKLIRDTVRYAGSPLKYSFSEVNHRKSVSVIGFNEKGNIDLELVALKPVRDMKIIKGPIDKLLDKDVYSLGSCDDYICAVITDDDYIIDAMGKLRRVYRNILKLEYDNKRSFIKNGNSVSNEFREMSPLELFSRFYYSQNNVELDDERMSILDSLIKDVLEGEG